MSKAMQVIIHDIATDGLPDWDDPTMSGRIALIFDGCIVSGWTLNGINETDDDGLPLWEGDSDVSHGRPFAGVKCWVEFPIPLREAAARKDGSHE